jgi:hypothetical protein
MGKVQKHSNPKCYTPSSEPFRIYKNIMLLKMEAADISKTFVPTY